REDRDKTGIKALPSVTVREGSYIKGSKSPAHILASIISASRSSCPSTDTRDKRGGRAFRGVDLAVQHAVFQASQDPFSQRGVRAGSHHAGHARSLRGSHTQACEQPPRRCCPSDPWYSTWGAYGKFVADPAKQVYGQSGVTPQQGLPGAERSAAVLQVTSALSSPRPPRPLTRASRTRRRRPSYWAGPGPSRRPKASAGSP